MLQKLSIKNFALIDELEVNFTEGFSIITGETGAGKSIILGGLGLILGNRADLSVLKDEDKKCIVEGEFNIDKYNYFSFFKEYDIDYDPITIIRREIAPNGKSRAFINDIPVRLNVLSELGGKLIDIHSQYQTLQLADSTFQFQIIDAIAKNEEELKTYEKLLLKRNILKGELEDLVRDQQDAKKQYDYNIFLYNELYEAKIKDNEQDVIEHTLEKLNNIDTIKQSFIGAIELANNEDIGIKVQLSSFKNNLSKLSSYGVDYLELFERITSLGIEFSDIVDELERANDTIDVSEEEIENYNNRLQLIYSLQKKHNVNSNIELLQIFENLAEKVASVENADDFLLKKENELKQIENELNLISANIHQKRVNILPELVAKLEASLANLAMQNSRFKITIENTDTYYKNGKDDLKFMFSANKGANFESLKKVASGGELSRIMLSVKALLCEHVKLPTILFDEIDTGVSGDVSNKIAETMKSMSTHMQVIAITHLPQIAAKGDKHFKVFKEEIDHKTFTNIKQLNFKERIDEIAEMLSGKELVNSAVEHAKQLLG